MDFVSPEVLCHGTASHNQYISYITCISFLKECDIVLVDRNYRASNRNNDVTERSSS